MLALSEWLSAFAFSRRLKHLSRDFSDAVLMAELLAQLLPAGAVQLHNYPPASRFQQKLINWETLNRKVLTPRRCELPHSLLEELARASPSAIALALVQVRKTVRIDPQTRSPSKRLPPTETTWSIPPSPSKTSDLLAQAGASPPVVKTAASPAKIGSPRSTQRGAGTTTGKPSSPTRQQQPLLRDYLPLPQDRPTPEAVINPFSRVAKRERALSPRVKSQTSEQQLTGTPCERKPHSNPSIASNTVSRDCDRSAANDQMEAKRESSCGVERREWPVSPCKSASPPIGFTTTELTRHKLSGVDLQLPLELRAAENLPPTSAAPASTAQADAVMSQLELCAPPTVFPRVLVDVEAVLSSSPRNVNASK